MDAQKLMQAVEVMNWLENRARELPEEQQKATRMRLTLTTAALYVAEYVFHSQRPGAEPYDALVQTVRGDARWTEFAEWIACVPSDFSDTQPERKL